MAITLTCLVIGASRSRCVILILFSSSADTTEETIEVARTEEVKFGDDKKEVEAFSTKNRFSASSSVDVDEGADDQLVIAQVHYNPTSTQTALLIKQNPTPFNSKNIFELLFS